MKALKYPPANTFPPLRYILIHFHFTCVSICIKSGSLVVMTYLYLQIVGSFEPRVRHSRMYGCVDRHRESSTELEKFCGSITAAASRRRQRTPVYCTRACQVTVWGKTLRKSSMRQHLAYLLLHNRLWIHGIEILYQTAPNHKKLQQDNDSICFKDYDSFSLY